jgi:hypothetical protein
MKKQLIILIMLIFILFPLTAQKTKDVVYLKNGSKIYGRIVEINDSICKFQTTDGNLLVYRIKEIAEFKNEDPFFEGRRKSGIGFALEAGVLAGAQSSKYDAPFSFNFLINVTNTTRNIFGIGSGVEYLGQSYMPLFAEYKILFNEKKTTPFIFIRGGKLFHLNGDFESTDQSTPQYNVPKSFEGGGSFTLGTGVSWARNDGETYLSFAYRNLHTSYKETSYPNQTSTFKTSFNRLEIKFGFRF